MVVLEPIAFEDRAQLRAMFDPYQIEHADLVDPERVYGDPTDYPYFDAYWVEPARRPFWIVADGVRVGFVLLNTYSPSGLGTDHAISEFTILPRRRRGGVGLAAALAAFATASGQWELQVYRANPSGFAFWPRVIQAARPVDWQVIEQDDRIIHRFRLAGG